MTVATLHVFATFRHECFLNGAVPLQAPCVTAPWQVTTERDTLAKEVEEIKKSTVEKEASEQQQQQE
eukprot:5254816-Amphidinium_carterae.1